MMTYLWNVNFLTGASYVVVHVIHSMLLKQYYLVGSRILPVGKYTVFYILGLYTLHFTFFTLKYIENIMYALLALTSLNAFQFRNTCDYMYIRMI